MSSNRQVVEKAMIAVSDLINDGGYLNPQQANEFIRKLVDQPTILRDLRVERMNSPVMEINKIGFSSRILRAAPASGTALASGDRAAPATEKVTLTTKEIIAEVPIPYDVLEDNIERGSLEDTIMDLITERAARDLEELIVLGDTGSADSYLALFNGVLKLATSHVVDYTDSALASVDRGLFKDMLKAMPSKYLRDRARMAFYVSPNAEVEYADSIAARETVLGDSKVTRDYVGNSPFGVPLKAAALMPDSQVLFTHPKNIILGIQRDVMIETERVIAARMINIVLTMRVALQFEEEDAVVKAIGVDVGSGPTTTTV